MRRFVFALLLGLAAPLAAGCAAESEETGDSQAAIESIPKARAAAETLKDRREKQQEIDTRLGKELALLGPLLTDAQNRAYAQRFYSLPENLEVRTAYLEAVDALATEVSRILHSPSLLDEVMNTIRVTHVAGRGSYVETYGPKDLYAACQLLAESPSAAVAVEFAARALEHSPSFAKLGKSDAAIEDEILAPALPNALVALLVTKPDAPTALSSLRGLLSKAQGAAPTVVSFLDALRLDLGKPIPATKYLDRRIGKAMTGLGIVLSVWQLGEGLDALRSGQIRKGLEDVLRGSNDAANGIGVAAKSYRVFFQAGEAPKWAGQVVQVTGRITGGLNALFGVLELVDDAKQWNAGVGEKLEVLSDCLAIASGLAALGGAVTASTGIGLLATGALFLAFYLEEREEQNAERHDKERILPSVGLPKALLDRGLLDTLLHANRSQVSLLARDLELSPTDLQWLAVEYPGAITGVQRSGQVAQLYGLLYLDDVFQFDGSQMAGFLKVLASGETDPIRREFAIRTVVSALYFGVIGVENFTGFLTKEKAVAWFEAASRDELLFNGEARTVWKNACLRAKAYVANPPPPKTTCLADGALTSGGSACCSGSAHYGGSSLVCGLN